MEEQLKPDKKNAPAKPRRSNRFFLASREDIFKKWEKVDPNSITEDQRPEASDVLAMIIAALSIVLPWVLVILGVFVVLSFVFGMILS